RVIDVLRGELNLNVSVVFRIYFVYCLITVIAVCKYFSNVVELGEANYLVELHESAGNFVAGSRFDVVLLSDKTNHIRPV
ncbi:MAG: hypothetical protein OXC80_02750, partial [Gammaproteobacteria bacterium]|nr:hypothetical protein [Gammaproteobacteria bacterium]